MTNIMQEAKDIREDGLIWTLFKVQSMHHKPDVGYLNVSD